MDKIKEIADKADMIVNGMHLRERMTILEF